MLRWDQEKLPFISWVEREYKVQRFTGPTSLLLTTVTATWDLGQRERPPMPVWRTEHPDTPSWHSPLWLLAECVCPTPYFSVRAETKSISFIAVSPSTWHGTWHIAGAQEINAFPTSYYRRPGCWPGAHTWKLLVSWTGAAGHGFK